MTTQAPLTVEQVFDGLSFRTNDGRDGTEFFFRGHLGADLVADRYYATFPEHRIRYPHAVDASSIRHEWHLFTVHEDTCYLATEAPADDADDFDPTLCSCSAAPSFDAGPGYEHRHPHPAAPGQPGAIPVTWATIGPA
ncbi:hypothetical protein ACH4TX_42020 [Streptomyces sp. NPDC021098]|uniref:hypothetical protein n=1 Tax=unclassified Streptomyces TaxID=2593676 RepID=UPI0037BB24E5